jgi:hypothetical protein
MRLTEIIDRFNQAIDPGPAFELFYKNILNPDTAIGHGLDIWGRIVGVERVLKITPTGYFGFYEARNEPFGFGPFYNGPPATDNYVLGDETYRLLIFAKARANISNGSTADINDILMSLFPNRGNAYIQEGTGPSAENYFQFAETTAATGFGAEPFYSVGSGSLFGMSYSYVFDFALAPYEVAIVANSGVLPKPAGIKMLGLVFPEAAAPSVPPGPTATLAGAAAMTATASATSLAAAEGAAAARVAAAIS